MGYTRLFSDLVETNPSVLIKRGSKYPFVAMEDVTPERRYVTANRQRKYAGGGARFQSGDILFARITPCLEHGKIAQFLGPPGQIGFGSTEFFVFRHKEGISDPAYVFYLVYTDIVRKPAEKSMSGASGRQRADLSAIKDLEVPAPSLSVQRKIAAIPSAYDDLIENNAQRIQILEEMARAIYREWFVNFRFPDHEKVKMVESELGPIPEGWETTTLGEVLVDIESGRRPKGGVAQTENGVPSVGAENIIGLGKYYYSKEKYVSRQFYESMRKGRIKDKDVLLYKDGALIGRKSMFRDGFPHVECCINEHVFILRTNERCTQNYLYFWLDQPDMTQNIRNLNTNAAQPGINQAGVRSLPILLPPRHLLEKFDDTVNPLLAELFNLSKQNNVLRHTRDLFLPKLISGELDVSELDITTEGL